MTTRVLLVEDNPADARLLRELLRDAERDYAVVHEERLERGLARLVEGGVDVVLLDLSLPDGSGLETVARTCAAAPDVPVIILTGLADEGLGSRAVLEGAQDYLVKGQVDTHLLVRAMRYAIERKRAEENVRRLIREQEARAQAEVAERRSRFLSEAGEVLASSLEYEDTVARVPRLAVPALADFCTVDLVDGRERLQRVSVAHASPQKQALAARAMRYPPQPTQVQHPVMRALATRKSQLVHDPRTIEAAAQSEEHLATIRAMAPSAIFVVPLVARGRVLGALSCMLTEPGRSSFSRDDLLTIEELARRAALALDNARLYRDSQLAARARDEVLGVVSHDLRNPLNVISMVAKLLMQQPEGPVEKRLKHVERIVRATERMTRLISDLLEVNRIEAGHLVIRQEPVAVELLLKDASELLAPLASAKSLDLEWSGCDSAAEVWADRERVLQIFSNLLGNALKFTEAGGRVTVSARREAGEVCFEVRDTGPGIDADALPHVFDRYWQGRGPARALGAGLGLPIARGIVEAHGGRIWAESEVGVGTTFWFTLPLGDARRATA